MRTIIYLIGVALFVAAFVSLLLGISDFHASILLCSGSLLAAASGRWIVGKKEHRTAGLMLMSAFCAYLLFATFNADQPNLAFSLFRHAWFGIPFIVVLPSIAVFLAFRPREKSA